MAIKCTCFLISHLKTHVFPIVFIIKWSTLSIVLCVTYDLKLCNAMSNYYKFHILRINATFIVWILQNTYISTTSMFHTLQSVINPNENSLGPYILLSTDRIAYIWIFFDLELAVKLIRNLRWVYTKAQN